jgi:hypothetical protein
MPRDPEQLAHQEWIGYVQPVGLVVSIPALLSAQAYVNRNVAPQQQKLLACLPRDAHDEPVPQICDFPAFAQEVLGWEPGDLVPVDGGDPQTDLLIIPLPEYNESLRPTYAVKEISPKEDGKPWLMLVQVIPTGANFDKIVTEDSRQWQATPHHRFERLLRETEVPIGLLVNGTHLRLVYAPRGETSGYATFPVAYMSQVAGRPIFAALYMLLCAERVFGFGLANPTKQSLSGILADSRKYQNVVSTQLAEQVLAALYELVRGFQAADDQRHGELLREVLANAPNHVYAGLLTVLMRLVFLLYAEDRGLVSGDPVYANFYSVTGLFERLRADAGRYPDTMDQRYGAWAQLLTLFRLIYEGGSHAGLHIPAREGYLFDPDRFNFLEGRPYRFRRSEAEARPEGSPPIPNVSDGVIFRVLNNLLILDGERLSYRTLDVEQIGSVYETMMGFNLRVAEGRSIAIKPTKSHGAPTTVNLEALLAAKPADRARWLKAETDQSVTGQALEALKKAGSLDELLAALDKKIAWHATPSVVPKGAMVLQPSDERRRSGSHYTPRSLTEPIVRTTLRPVLERLGANPKPEQLLDLKICDPAMGSGAFLVEACRQLGDELVKAWHVHQQVPKLPPDEDEILHARRVIAQRCLYGVDKNPMAVDLAKLSLWLATLAKDHPFTFLDHALRPGDSLVGLTQEQIACFHWAPKKQRDLFRKQVEEKMKHVTRFRQEILASRDDVFYEYLRSRLEYADEQLSLARLAGNVVISAFFSADSDRKRQAPLEELEVKMAAYLSPQGKMEDRQPLAHAEAELLTGERPIQPFHWWMEFPEVFLRENGGFDAIVGNPPFAGKNTLIKGSREGYVDWLKMVHEESHGNSDLVAHFFRRAFNLLRRDGCFGLIATNTIGQGDTRTTGLRWICKNGGTIFAARKRLKWPGLAAVVVSVVHVCRGQKSGPFVLDGRSVSTITAYLFHSGGHADPAALAANQERSFQGCILLGMGFTFDGSGSEELASPLSVMKELIRKEPRNAERIFPYIGGEEVNDSPTHSPSRYVINFVDWPLRRDAIGELWVGSDEKQKQEWLRTGIVPLDYPGSVAADYPRLLEIVERQVKPERESQNDEYGRRRWWHFLRPRPELHRAIAGLDRVLVCSRIANAFAFTFMPSGIVLNEKIVVFPFASSAPFCVIQSRVHEVWARFFSSTLKDDLQYTPSLCFETFPFPVAFETNVRLEQVGREYFTYRSTLMIRNNQGLTKTYNHFHDPSETSPGILKLRELHAMMDQAVLEAYDWHDLAKSAICEFLLDYEDEEEDEEEASRRKKPWRYRWPDDFRDEVLGRLLELNKQRAEEDAIASEVTEEATKRSLKKVRTKGKGRTRRGDDGALFT